MINKILSKLKRLKYKSAIAAPSIEKRFANIYANNLWFKNGQSKSGSGSSIEATEQIRVWLPEVLSRLNAKNLTDLGCGDFYWMKQVNLPCKYIGLDIVPKIIEANKFTYGNFLHVFEKHNAVTDKLPDEADIVLCREVLFHLSFKDSLKAVDQILKSNARYLLITTSQELTKNLDIRTGEFRNLNLTLSPFNFPESQEYIRDSKIVNGDRYIGVWNLENLRG